jgi:hypothetical protein
MSSHKVLGSSTSVILISRTAKWVLNGRALTQRSASEISKNTETGKMPTVTGRTTMMITTKAQATTRTCP